MDRYRLNYDEDREVLELYILSDLPRFSTDTLIESYPKDTLVALLLHIKEGKLKQI